MAGSHPRLRFFDFELDLRAGRLRRAGQIVRLQPQPLRVLAILAEQAGHVVSRGDLRRQVWDDATFVEFDQGLNYCIRQIRLALNDDAARPVYLETIKKQGYRFVAPVLVENDGSPEPSGHPEATRSSEPSGEPGNRHGSPRFAPARLLLTIAGLILGVVGGGWLYRWPHAAGRSSGAPLVDIRPITDFADSALAPALSPDGRMLAFIRGDSDFLTPDQIYVKMLPGGEPSRLTNDSRLKYGPTFSPDGSEVAYTVMEHSGWATYAVSVLGGEPHLVLANAAGLTWLAPHRVLFSQIIQGQHMGLVAGTDMRGNLQELYTPAHERGMAHYAFASPNGQAALVVEMDERPVWLPCRLIALNGAFQSRTAGPAGPCTSAGWSPDGRWMYVGAAGHLWRQEFPAGSPEQLTFGAGPEAGVAVDPDGGSLIASIGGGSSTIWLHEASRDRPLSSEGQVVSSEGSISSPAFSPTGARSTTWLVGRARGRLRNSVA
jgi:DNA-binding winged helix-turn-helix (wHTH) protein